MYSYYMHEEITYKWRIKWQGRWVTTRYHCTKEQIRRAHPEAICLEHTRTVREVPSTPQESAQVMIDRGTSGFLRGCAKKPDGTR